MKGLGAIKGAVSDYNNNSNATYLKKEQKLNLKDGESAIVRFFVPMEDVHSVYEHAVDCGNHFSVFTCRNDADGNGDCEACRAKIKRTFKSYIPLMVRSDSNKVKICLAGVKMGAQILGQIEEYGDITKRDFKMTRTGSKMNNTVYQFFPKDPSPCDLGNAYNEIPDLDALLAVKENNEILRILNGAIDTSSTDEETESYSSEETTTTTKPKGDKYPF